MISVYQNTLWPRVTSAPGLFRPVTVAVRGAEARPWATPPSITSPSPTPKGAYKSLFCSLLYTIRGSSALSHRAARKWLVLDLITSSLCPARNAVWRRFSAGEENPRAPSSLLAGGKNVMEAPTDASTPVLPRRCDPACCILLDGPLSLRGSGCGHTLLASNPCELHLVPCQGPADPAVPTSSTLLTPLAPAAKHPPVTLNP